MKPDFPRQAKGKRAYRRKANGTCGVCRCNPSIEGQGRCKTCHAIHQRFWRAKEKVKNRTLDDDVRMVQAGMELLQRRLGIGVRGALRRAA